MESEKIFTEVMARLDALVQQLGEGAAHVYMVFAKQAFGYGVVDLFIAVVALVVFIIAFRSIKGNWSRKRGHSQYEDAWKQADNDQNWHNFLIVVGILVSIVSTVVFIWCSSMGLLRVLNPEYYAMTSLLRTLMGK